MKKFIVIGTIRAATTYISELWTAIGVQCLHEEIFDQWSRDFNTYRGWIKPKALGVSSFSAMPFVDRIEDPHIVFHQKRDKDKVIASIMRFNWLRSFDKKAWDLQNFIDHHCDGKLKVEPDYEKRLSLFYDIWNAKCERAADLSYDIEDLTPELMLNMCDMIGYKCDIDIIEKAMGRISKTING